MSETKNCPSCGTSLFLSDAYCYKCGLKQDTVPAETPEKAEQQVKSEQPGNVEQPIKAEQPGTTEYPGPISSVGAQPAAEMQNATQAEPKAQNPDTQNTTQAGPTAQSPEIHAQIPASSLEIAKKKRFPWFFTILWSILLLAVGLWGYFLFFDARYDYPRFTEDAQRLVLFTAAVACLVYTVSLKLTMRKLRALPTILMVIAFLVIFYGFCMVELTTGDWLHDALSNITNNLLPASGY